jgi:two-component system, OmpR family, sensor kinase
MTGDEVILPRATHDLRGELATMVTGVHYLMRYEGGVGDSGKQMLERVNGAGKRLGRLIDELEQAAWIGGQPAGALVIEPLRLGPLVQGALGRLERSITDRRVTVRAELPGDLPELDGDAELLGAALEHVLDFAVARSPGRAVGVVALGAARLSVTDEGGAVDAGVLGRLFDPFVEKEILPRPEPGARRRERLGLGLAIARGIFAAHGGGLAAGLAPGGQGIVLSCALGA